MDKENLVKVSTYAKENDVSVQTVYKWIASEKVESVIIDGVQFIKRK